MSPPDMKTLPSLLLACALALPAFAQNITATLLEVVPGTKTSGTYDGVTFEDYNAGIFRFDEFDAFCVEPIAPIEYGDTILYTYQDPATLANADQIGRLLGAWNASSKSSLDAQAIQWAIWEIILDGSDAPSFATGNSRLADDHDDVAARALEFLASAPEYDPLPFLYLTNECKQDMIVAVPEPGLLGLLTLSAITLFRRRR